MSLSEDPCISLLEVGGFVLDAIFPLECFSNMAETKSRSIKTQKENEANTQPS